MDEPRTLRGLYEELVLRPLIERTLEVLVYRGVIPPMTPLPEKEEDPDGR